MFFNARKIKQLKRENEALRRTIDQLRAVNDANKFSIRELHKQIDSYQDLIELEDRTAIISHGGGGTSLMIGGKRIGNITSIEIEPMTAGSPAILNIGILAEKVIIRKGKTQVWKKQTQQNKESTENDRESTTRIKRIDVTTLAD
jgi:hypothetical protein